MKNIILLLLCAVCTSATPSQRDFFSAVDSALAGNYPPAHAACAEPGSTQASEWQHFVDIGDSAMAAAICSEQIAHAHPGTSDFRAMANYLDDYYRTTSDDETLLFRMMDTETRNLKAGCPDPVRLARISELLATINPQRAADCNTLAFNALMQQQEDIDGIDWNDHLEKLQSTAERSAPVAIIITAIAFLGIGALSAIAVMRRRYRLSRPDDNEHDKSREPDSGAKAMLSLALAAFAQTKELNLLVDRKLTVGQSKDLYNSINSGKIIGEASEKFFTSFDGAILTIKPTFVADVNSLLLPEKRFAPGDDGRLTPELRLAALIHMDITDSSRLSEILGLSMNTIYTYRNRLKGRARNRATFENELKSI